jgi:hypothetical protein
MSNARVQQRFNPPRTAENIDPSGDPIIDCTDSDGFIPIAYQNVHRVRTTNFIIPTKLETLEAHGIDVMGMSETNCPWTPQAQSEFNFIMNQCFKSSRTVYSSSLPSSNSRYQPGGNLLTVNGHTTGQIANTGLDSWGRFCWFCLQGHWDEGILVITAYRVCQEKGSQAGSHIAYQQQCTLMRQAGISDPNPRQHVLEAIRTLIQEHRAKGYRPIVMMDANGDYRTDRAPDRALAIFITNSNLVNPFYEKFATSPRTFLYGLKRLDYIFMDPALTLSIWNIGYLCTHMGADSDHCLAYVDLDKSNCLLAL